MPGLKTTHHTNLGRLPPPAQATLVDPWMRGAQNQKPSSLKQWEINSLLIHTLGWNRKGPTTRLVAYLAIAILWQKTLFSASQGPARGLSWEPLHL